MGFKFKKVVNCEKCNTEMSYYKPSSGGYYKCEKCNNVKILD